MEYCSIFLKRAIADSLSTLRERVHSTPCQKAGDFLRVNLLERWISELVNEVAAYNLQRIAVG